MVNTAVCVGENLQITADGRLQMARHSVPRNLVDEIVKSTGDTNSLGETATLPGRLLMNKQVQWTNDSPVDHDIRIEITRRWRRWVTSNPNAVQFRDRWSWVITPAGAASITLPQEPVTTGTVNGQVGSAEDTGTNTVAEPNPGVFYHWWGTSVGEEWIGPVKPGETVAVWYRMYVWTPPPFSDNANKNAPVHQAEAGWARIALMGFPEQGQLVTG
jgi:hypothetical protein